MKLSFVIPCYNSEKTIGQVVEQIIDVKESDFKDYDYEIILVNDCSRDKTCDAIKSLAENNSNIIAISLAKNVGQHGAIMAGLNYASGDYVVTLDDDCQTPIENLKKMKDKLDEGFDVVSAKYVARPKTSIIRSMGTKLNRAMTKWLINAPEGISVSVFLILKKFVVDKVVEYKNPYPYLSGLILRVTHNIGNVEMEQRERAVGQSGYSFKKLLSLWINGFTAFSIRPLRIATMLGLSSSLIGVIFAIIVIIRKIVLVDIQLGWSSTIVLLLVIGGLILFVLGIMGEYVGRIYMCINDMPQFVVKEINAVGSIEKVEESGKIEEELIE